jgi:hypothetical protein
MIHDVQNKVPNFDRATLLKALLELQRAELLAPGTFPSEKTGSKSRREIIRSAAKVAVVALPAVISIVVPTADAAVSCFPVGHACRKPSDWYSRLCGVGLLCV